MEQHFGQTHEQSSNGRVSSLENVVATKGARPAPSLDEIDSLLSFLPLLPAGEVKNPPVIQHTGTAESLQVKTEPASFVEVAKHFEIEPNNWVVFEDGDVGLENALLAGMKVVDVRKSPLIIEG